MPPDPLLATIIDAVTGPDGPGVGTLTDDQLVGVIAAVRRLESRVAWYALTAVAEFAARWGGEVAGAEFAADQLACELHLTSRSAAVQLDYATAVAGGCRGAWPRCSPACCIRCICGSSKRKLRSCPRRTPPPRMRCWRRRRGC